MKRIARLGIVVLVALLMMGCLTDPLEIPENGKESLPALSLNPCDEIPDWFTCRRFKVKEGYMFLNENEMDKEDLSGLEISPKGSIYEMGIPEDSTGYSVTTEDTYRLQYTIIENTVNESGQAMVVTIITSINVDRKPYGVDLLVKLNATGSDNSNSVLTIRAVCEYTDTVEK